MIPKKACPGLGSGWKPVFGKGHAQTKEERGLALPLFFVGTVLFVSL
jgi:hypothetical protein